LLQVCVHQLWCVASVCCNALQCVALCCSVLHLCVTVCCTVMPCVAVCCSLLKCVAVCFFFLLEWHRYKCTPTHSQAHGQAHTQEDVSNICACCSVLQCAAVCCSMLQCVAECSSILQYFAVCCGVMQCAAVCCSVLQCDEDARKICLCCSVLLYVAVCFTRTYVLRPEHGSSCALQYVAACCSMLLRVAVRCLLRMASVQMHADTPTNTGTDTKRHPHDLYLERVLPSELYVMHCVAATVAAWCANLMCSALWCSVHTMYLVRPLGFWMMSLIQITL